MAFWLGVGQAITKGAEAIEKTPIGKGLDILSAVAKNPLAILAPGKAGQQIKETREKIAAGDREAAATFTKTLAVQTAFNVATVAGGAGALGQAVKTGVTKIASKAVVLGAVSAPLIVGSSTIRETVATTSPIELGVKTGEKIEKLIKDGSKGAEDAAKILGYVGAGALVAGGILTGKAIYDKLKDGKEEDNKKPDKKPDKKPLPTDTTKPESSLQAATLPTNTEKPQVPEVVEVKPTTKGKKRKKYKKKREVPYINIKIDNREDNDVYDRKVYKGRRY